MVREFIKVYLLHQHSTRMSFKVHLFESVRQVHLVNQGIHQLQGVQVQKVNEIVHGVVHLVHLATRTYLIDLVLQLIDKAICLLWNVCQIIQRPRWSSGLGVMLMSILQYYETSTKSVPDAERLLLGSITELQKQVAATSSALAQSE